MSILELKNVSYIYKNRYQSVTAVDHVSYSFETGKVYALVGKSGSGKTTLLSMLSGLEIQDYSGVPEKELQKWRLDYASKENEAKEKAREDELMQSFFKDKGERDRILRSYASREKEIYRVMFE